MTRVSLCLPVDPRRDAACAGDRAGVGNAALAICFGRLAGYGFLFDLIGGISPWPIPGAIAAQLPGETARWRGAHVGGITDGLMATAIGVALPLAPMPARSAPRDDVRPGA